uniref:Dynein assembly factor with WD repeat domains 1 n=1 Tax=Scleropages formosus TaxID=113540 RepID=A0A8C9TEH5_SCLFO
MEPGAGAACARSGSSWKPSVYGPPRNMMKLKRFLLRYYPPGIMLEYEKGGELKTKSIDLLDLSPETDTEKLVAVIRETEPLITESRTAQLKQLICRLQEKLSQQDDGRFYLFKTLQAHILPLTNVAFNKSGSRFITGSYDRTCRIWDTISGEELQTLEGHKNVVYAVAFNNPYGYSDFVLIPGSDMMWSSKIHSARYYCCLVYFTQSRDKVATGSFDKTCKLWCAETGKCFHTYRGHTAEIVLVTLSFNTDGNQLVTGSFDHTASLWDVVSGRRVHMLIGHTAEISSVQFNWDCSLIATGSIDKTCKVWDMRNMKCMATLGGHQAEVLDVCFNYTGQLIATASADGTARVYSAATGLCIARLEGHDGEISKICFNPKGSHILTASADKTARLWDVASGSCLQVLGGHTDEIFSCAFNYESDIIITGSKDNTCKIWRMQWRDDVEQYYL